jgi:2'-5' RNA ligase
MNLKSKEYSSAVLRLFIAIAIPPTVRKAIEHTQSQLRGQAPPGAIRWSKPEQYHTTLKFLGNVPTDHVEMLKNSVLSVCNTYRAIRLSARGIGFFPNKKKPKVMWVGTNDCNGELARLHQLLNKAVQQFEPKVKTEKFTGHITLGYVEEGYQSAIENLLKYTTVFHERHFGDWLAKDVKIIRSELTSAGASYIPLVSCPLVE